MGPVVVEEREEYVIVTDDRGWRVYEITEGAVLLVEEIVVD